MTLSALSFHPMNSQAIEHDRQAYFRAHPLGAAAVKHPRIVIDHGRYVAILGRSISRGVVGFGTSVASALRAFDHIYLSYLYSQRR